MKTQLQHFLPPNGLELVNSIIKSYSFHFKITKHRVSKLGDYRYDSRTGKHMITINGTLNQYAFLITFLHEVAHMVVNLNYKRGVKPHGKEWKYEFAQLLDQSLALQCYPSDVEAALLVYKKNPAASSSNHQPLYAALKNHDENKEDQLFLRDISEGAFFIFRKKQYRKIRKQRTRSLCEQIGTGRRYLISELAEVEKSAPYD